MRRKPQSIWHSYHPGGPDAVHENTYQQKPLSSITAIMNRWACIVKNKKMYKNAGKFTKCYLCGSASCGYNKSTVEVFEKQQGTNFLPGETEEDENDPIPAINGSVVFGFLGRDNGPVGSRLGLLPPCGQQRPMGDRNMRDEHRL